MGYAARANPKTVAKRAGWLPPKGKNTVVGRLAQWLRRREKKAT